MKTLLKSVQLAVRLQQITRVSVVLATLCFASSKASAGLIIGITVNQDPYVYYGDPYSGWAHVNGCPSDTATVMFEAYDCFSTNAPTITCSQPPTNICKTTVTATNGVIYWNLSDFTGTPTNLVFTASFTPPGDPTEYCTNVLYVDGCSGACSTCTSCSSIGSPTADVNQCLSFKIGLGPGTILNNAGYLWLHADTPSAALGTPAALQLPVSPPSIVTVVTNSGGISQVLAPFGLTIVTNVGASQYQLQVFTNGTFTGPPGGPYSPGTNAPYMTYAITNSYVSGNSDVLTITQEQTGLSNRVFQYTYSNSGTNQLRWDLLQPDGTTLSKWYETVTNYLTNSFWQTSVGTNILKQTCAAIQYIPTAGLYLTNSLVEGVGTVTQTTTYTFYATNAATGSSNQLQRVDYPNGNWVYYQYDASSRVTNMYSAFGNSTPPAPGVVPDVVSNQCRQTTYDFTPIVGTPDDGTYQPNQPRSTAVILPASGATNGRAEVSRTYFEVEQFHTEQELCPVPGAAYGAPGNVRTVTYFYPDEAGGIGTAPEQGRMKSVSHPDGSATFYDYEYVVDDSGNTNLETDVYTGTPDDWEQPGKITDGTETSTVEDQYGRTLSRTANDLLTGDTLAESTYTYSASDPLGRDYTLTDNLASLSTVYEYACCGLDSVTDPDGVVTLYGYDSMRRPVTVTTLRGTNAITITSTYDGLGRVVETQRTGTDNSTITQSQTGYDVLNRVIASTNALGGVTTTSNVVVNNQQTVTNIFPDGGTSVELDYRDGSLQKLTGTAIAPMRYTNFAMLDGGSYRSVQQQIKLDASGNDTSEWTETVMDGAGRPYKTIYASAGTNHPFAISYYSTDTNDTETAGLLTNQIDPDGVSTMYVYNPKGELALTVVDVNQNNNIDWSGPDRITFTTNYATNDFSTTCRRTDTYVWDSSTSTSNLLSTVESSADGLRQWNITLGSGTPVTNFSQTIYPGSGSRVTTNMAPNGAYTVSAYLYGQLISMTSYDASNVQVGQVTNGYDPHGRMNIRWDARNGTTSNSFNNADEVVASTTPVPVTGQSPEVTTSYYDLSERMVGTQLPDGTYTTNYLNPTGQANQSFGSREYPVGNGYDSQQRMTTMTNWTDFLTDAGSRVTTWNYDQYRGWLASKEYADGTETIYGNTAAGRLSSRLWARGTNTSYSYNNAGDLATVTYNDGVTPGITNGYNRLGQKAAVTNSVAGITNVYNDAGLLLSQAYTNGPLAGWSVTNGYDSFMRRTNMVVLSNTTPVWTNIFTYDAASRLATVSDGVNSAGYSYVANSPLVSQITFKQSGTTRMTTTKQYDLLNRLTSIGTTNAGSATICSSAYGYNSANQRTSMTNADGSYWVYGYDSLGQVTSAVKYWSDGTPAPGEQFGNAFDDIGNRVNSQMGGNANGLGLRNANYTANDLNQYTSRTVPGAVDILGSATNTATVTVNGVLAYRHGSNYEATLPISNAGNAVWQLVTNEGVLGASTNTDATITGSLFLPQNPENFSYDPDGNLISDGRFTNVWDAENRLIGMTNTASIAAAGKYALSIAYDYQGRRIQKIVYTNSGSAWIASYTNKFIYDGWNLVAILDGGNNLLDSFVWGNDLSGSQQGAGGVGGLISMTVYSGANTGTYFYCYDGNGNVMALVNASNGAIAGQYEYGPFGELIRASGPMAKLNPFRFSTKYQDDETDLLYYGYRYYNPSTGRWLNRDPIGERGGLSLYCFVANNTVNRFDCIGLCCCVKKGPNAHWVRQNNSPHPDETFQLTFQTLPDGSSAPGGKGCCKFNDCGFRQLVEGHQMINGQRLPFNSGAHLPITENNFVDDGISMADNEDSNPSFLFQDSSGGGGPYDASWDIDIWMSFKAQVFDTSANNKIVAEKDGYWIRIAGMYDPQYRMTHGGFD